MQKTKKDKDKRSFTITDIWIDLEHKRLHERGYSDSEIETEIDKHRHEEES